MTEFLPPDAIGALVACAVVGAVAWLIRNHKERRRAEQHRLLLLTHQNRETVKTRTGVVPLDAIRTPHRATVAAVHWSRLDIVLDATDQVISAYRVRDIGPIHAGDRVAVAMAEGGPVVLGILTGKGR